MFDVYIALKNYVPVKKCLKFRRDGRFTIVCSTKQRFHYLNSSASEIFLWCDGKHTIDDIRLEMSTLYNAVPKDILSEDLVRIIRDFQWKDIIELREKNG